MDKKKAKKAKRRALTKRTKLSGKQRAYTAAIGVGLTPAAGFVYYAGMKQDKRDAAKKSIGYRAEVASINARYKLTSARKAALKKAQQASARLRRKSGGK